MTTRTRARKTPCSTATAVHDDVHDDGAAQREQLNRFITRLRELWNRERVLKQQLKDTRLELARLTRTGSV